MKLRFRSLLLALLLAGPAAGLLPRAAAQVAPAATFEAAARQLYGQLGAEAAGLRYEVFAQALAGYLNLARAGRLGGPQARLAVIDFDLPSTVPRLWVLDVATRQLLFHTLVAHGRNSGEDMATQFSNTDGSNQSSLGFYLTGSQYEGQHGHSLRLTGVDEGFNTNAATRDIVLHGADYVSQDFIRANGRLGRSLACPALPLDSYAQIIDALRDGSCLFIHRSGAGYASPYLAVPAGPIAGAGESLRP